MRVSSNCPVIPDEEIKADINRAILDWMIGDAERAITGKAYMGAIILGICAIDVLSGLRAGKNATDKTFRDFVHEYMPNEDKYIENDLYKNMRCKLVHGYSSIGFQYTDEHPEKHLTGSSRGVWIHVNSFIAEVRTAASSYLEELFIKEDLWKSFRKRWQNHPLLGPIPDD